MIVRIFWAALAVLTLSTTLALADAQRLAAQKCALSTRAPGNYNVSNAPGLPHVLPGQGGTTDGAARINDCLKDAYGLQYGARPGTTPAADITPQTAAATVQECKRIRNRRIGAGVAGAVGFTLGLGDPYTAAAIGGAVGVGIATRRENRRYADCVAAATAPPVDTNAAIYVGCSRRGGVMSRGTSLCVAP